MYLFTSALGNNVRKTRPRWQRTVSRKTWITDKRPCRTKLHPVSLTRRNEPRTFVYSSFSQRRFYSTEPTAGEQSTPSSSSHSSSSSSSSAQSLNSAAALGSAPSNTSSSSSSSSSSASGQASASVLSSALLQDPALLHQLLPALQATLQMNNGSMDVAKLNEGEDGRGVCASTAFCKVFPISKDRSEVL